jgi:hypothetical protein
MSKEVADRQQRDTTFRHETGAFGAIIGQFAKARSYEHYRTRPKRKGRIVIWPKKQGLF